jgi:tRNA A-37 threonylcarbamoyl transferase component Bud32
MCGLFFILLVVLACVFLLSPSARATLWRGNGFFGLFSVLLIPLVLVLIGLALYGIARSEGGRAWAVFSFLLLTAFGILAIVWLRRGSAWKSAAPFFPAPDQRRWCPTCGNPLPANAPHGICPRCLLREGLQSPPPQAAPAIAPFGDVGKFFGGLFPPQDARISPATGPYPSAFRAPSPADLAPHFPGLEILEFLGQGGMGAVYKARQKKLDRLVALKILPSESSRDPAFAERFNREAQALGRLNHPNIIAVHDFGEAGDLFYFIMEYVDGVNLRQVMQAGKLQPDEALRIIPQVCDALQYAHDEGIVHRDIKPENILLDKRGRVKIADFGLAKLLSRPGLAYTLTGSQQIMGTPHYMAPEQMEKPTTVDHRADIYSLGVVFYEMLTGELPLGRFALPSEKAPVDGRLDEIVLRTLEKDPGRRYQRVSEIKTDMEAVAGGLPSPLSPVRPIRSFEQEVDLEMRRLQVIGPAIGLIVAGILGVVFWTVLLIVSIVEDLHQHGLVRYWRDYGLLIVIMAPLVPASAALVLAGGRKLMRVERYEFVMFASIWALLPWSGAIWPIGLAMGVWALTVLRRPEIKLAFVRNKVHARLSGPPPGPPTGPYRGKFRSMVGAVGSLFLGSRVAHETGTQSASFALQHGPALGTIEPPAAMDTPVQATAAPTGIANRAPPALLRKERRASPAKTVGLVIAILVVLALVACWFVIGSVQLQKQDDSMQPEPGYNSQPDSAHGNGQTGRPRILTDPPDAARLGIPTGTDR